MGLVLVAFLCIALGLGAERSGDDRVAALLYIAAFVIAGLVG